MLSKDSHFLDVKSRNAPLVEGVDEIDPPWRVPMDEPSDASGFHSETISGIIAGPEGSAISDGPGSDDGGRFLMTSLGHAVDEFLNRVTAWARHQPTLPGVALVGSHARGEARPDSDIDLVLLCTHPTTFLDDISWARRFGEMVTCQTEEWGRLTSLRVSYRHGLEVEFGLTTPAWAQFPIDAGTRRVVSKGMRILLDKEGTLGRLLDAVSQKTPSGSRPRKN
jgi:uncharacterized protein